MLNIAPQCLHEAIVFAFIVFVRKKILHYLFSIGRSGDTFSNVLI